VVRRLLKKSIFASRRRSEMKAMILAAGLGTRLRPLTDNTPKALAPIGEETLLSLLIRKLHRAGFNEIIVNVHHFAEQVRSFLNTLQLKEMRIEVSDESDKLLDTGGGLKKASWFFDDEKPFLLHNVDVMSALDLNNLYRTHIQKGPLATLAVSDRESFRYLFFDDEDVLRGWKNTKTDEVKPQGLKEKELHPFAFSGIHIIDPLIFSLTSEEGKFSMIDLYIRLSKIAEIRCYKHKPEKWMDIGTPAALEKANRRLPVEFLT
jgi:NDP-sugar pyrophosphorylase family protein